MRQERRIRFRNVIYNHICLIYLTLKVSCKILVTTIDNGIIDRAFDLRISTSFLRISILQLNNSAFSSVTRENIYFSSLLRFVNWASCDAVWDLIEDIQSGQNSRSAAVISLLENRIYDEKAKEPRAVAKRVLGLTLMITTLFTGIEPRAYKGVFFIGRSKLVVWSILKLYPWQLVFIFS